MLFYYLWLFLIKRDKSHFSHFENTNIIFRISGQFSSFEILLSTLLNFALYGIPLHYYLYLGAILFCLGLLVVLTRRNVIIVLMGIELMLNAANINLVAFSYFDSRNLEGQMFTLFNIVIAASEAAVGLALIIRIYKQYGTVHLDAFNKLNG